MVVYCRIHGLASEKGRMMNGCVGEILGDNSAHSGKDRVAVKVDGVVVEPKLIKFENLLLLESDTAEVKHYTISYAFNQTEPNTFKFAMYDGGDLLVAGGGITPNGKYATSLQTIVLAVKALLSGSFHFNTPTVLHVPVLNAAVALNKLLAGNTDLTAVLKSMPNAYTPQTATFLKDAVEVLQRNPHTTFVKWTPNQNYQSIHCPTGASFEGAIEPEDGSMHMHESHHKWGDMPAVYSFFPPLLLENQFHIMNVWLGIYHIYPHRSIANCFDVIYAANDKGTLTMGSFMNMVEGSIAEGYIFTKVLQGTKAVTGSHIFEVDPITFWNILLHLEVYFEREEHGFMVLPHFDGTPAKNRAMLKKRTTAKDDEQGLLLPPAHTTFSSQQERQERSDRHARIGALMCMIELKKRFRHTEITLEVVAPHLVGTNVARDMQAALDLVNRGRFAEAARVLNNGGSRTCGYCGIMEQGGDAATTAFSTCSGCAMVDYCSSECLMNDHRVKHQELCAALAADRDGQPPRGEVNYITHIMMRTPFPPGN